MEGFQLDVGEIRNAADAVGRNSDYLGDMAKYCKSLGPSKDGAEFGELLAKFHKGYESVVKTQVEVLKDMKEKLGLTRDALEGTADDYSTNDSDAGDRFGEIEEPDTTPPSNPADSTAEPADPAESEDGES